MAAYAVIARIDRVDPHLAGWSRMPAPPTARSVVDEIEPSEAFDLVGRPDPQSLAERWARVRESWSQTTFYLFDPESWR
jgi:hypothetical protein